VGAGEDRRIRLRWTLTQPSLEDLTDVPAQGSAAELAPLAEASDVSAGAKHHVLAAECGQLRHPQARLDGHEEERAVAPSDPGGGVWRNEEDLDLFLGQEFDDPALEPLARDREDSLAEERVGWCRESDEAEEGVECRESGVAAAGGVATLALEVVEELAEESRVEIGELELGGGMARGA
jgi:hypothetical protein